MPLTPPRPNGHQLVHAMQSDVSSASSDQDIGRKLEELEQGLTDAHDQQAATNEIPKADITIQPQGARCMIGLVTCAK
jgi:hypothetical protein